MMQCMQPPRRMRYSLGVAVSDCRVDGGGNESAGRCGGLRG
jgi:hypothetical protein